MADAITPDMTIASVTERWPDTARIFARYGLGCASCAISKSETVLQGAMGHGGGRVATAVFAGQKAARQRAVGDHADTLFGAQIL